MKDLLRKLSACEDAREWVANKTWKEVHDTCHRGDWLLWLHCRTNPEDLQDRTLAKGHCANTVRHLMKDKRSTDAVDAAIAFGEGRITKTELKNAADAADAAAVDAAADAAAAAAVAYAAADAAYAAADAAYAAVADDDAYAAYAAVAAVAAADAYAAADARKLNQQATADIVRKYIPFEQWNCQKMIDELKTK